MMRKRWMACVCLCLWSAAGSLRAQEPRAERPERSVVRIVVYSQRGDWYSPWRPGAVQAASGSGFVIQGGAVMTNAHVVSDARLVLLFLHNDPEPHPADVYRIAHDADLALVRPRDAHLLDRIPALALAEGLPALGSTVETLGYPVGGSRVSSTRGVVSRVEDQQYLHSGADRHLAVQTDAAINAGNSGGPVIQSERVIGVAFQAYTGLQNVGYFIPGEVVARFLHDVEDGTYDGYPELGLQAATLQSPSAREKAGLGPSETGVRVERVVPSTSCAGLVSAGDVLLEVDGRAVANDGTVADADLRIPFGLLVDRRQIGEEVTLRLLRDGTRQTVRVRVTAFPGQRRLGNLYDQLPRYLIYGGLVFVPLDLEMLKTFGNNWQASADRLLLDAFALRPLADPTLFTVERVVLLRRLDHEVNAHIAWSRNELVERVNGKPIRSLDDLAAELASHDGSHQVLELSNHRRFVVLDRLAAERTHDEILKQYGIQKDRRL
jgi:S1-C subfamily serine protease